MSLFDGWGENGSSVFDCFLELGQSIIEDNSDSEYTENLVLFVSFDLVNSTRFKAYNNSDWFNVIYTITDSIRTGISSIDKNFQLWRSIGDEVVFTISVSDRNTLENLINSIFKLLNKICKDLKNGDIFRDKSGFNEIDIENLIEQNILSVKATAWIALVSDKDNPNKKYNIQYEYDTKYLNDLHSTKIIEFQGNDIDAGFRLSKECTNPRRLTLSIELAYILAHNKHIEPKIHIITYKKLKGIWNEKLYPVIWYHDEYIAGCKMQNSFFYDEAEEEEIVKKFIDENIKNNKIKILGCSNKDITFIIDKIIEDRNLTNKIKKINEIIDLNTDSEGSSQVLAGNLIEVHCVAVCVNSENKVLLLKRNNNLPDSHFPGKWEFGCSKMIYNRSFKEILEEDYKENFGLDIEIGSPFADYDFLRNGVKIPGIRYKAKVLNDSSITFDEFSEKAKEKYSDFKFVDITEFKEFSKEDIIDNSYSEFERIISEIGK